MPSIPCSALVPFRRSALLLGATVPLLAWTFGSGQGIPKPRPAPQRAFPETSERGNARIFYWGGDHSGGELAIDYGQPAWKDEYDAAVEKQRGTRWRLGQNFWTHLDTNIDLAFGAQEVLAGLYYLVLERKTDGAFVLVALDPTEVRDRHLDAFEAAKTTGGLEIPLEYKHVDTRADKLALRLDVDATRKDGGTLVIQFGRHELRAAFTMKPAE